MNVWFEMVLFLTPIARAFGSSRAFLLCMSVLISDHRMSPVFRSLQRPFSVFPFTSKLTLRRLSPSLRGCSFIKSRRMKVELLDMSVSAKWPVENAGPSSLPYSILGPGSGLDERSSALEAISLSPCFVSDSAPSTFVQDPSL